jgi:hypothetical protein
MNHRRLQRPNRELRRGLREGCRATQTHMQGKHRGLKRCPKLQKREGSLVDSVSQSEPPVQIPRFQDFARSSYLALRLPEPYRKPAADERLTSADNENVCLPRCTRRAPRQRPRKSQDVPLNARHLSRNCHGQRRHASQVLI